MTVDMISHPPHYVGESGVECLDIIDLLPMMLGTGVKYIWRYSSKWNAAEDLGKATFYFERYQKKLFKSKNTTALILHSQTAQAAQEMWNTSTRDSMRKHIVWLQETNAQSFQLFEAIYLFLSTARHGVVSHSLFEKVLEELQALSEKVYEEEVK